MPDYPVILPDIRALLSVERNSPWSMTRTGNNKKNKVFARCFGKNGRAVIK
jgi:hypothetical protein